MYSLKTRNLRAADWNENRPGPPAVYLAAIKCALLRGIKRDGDPPANRKEPFDLVHVEKFFARNLGGLIHARPRVPGRLGKATSRTPSRYVDEKSDEAIVLTKRLNKGRQLPAEVVEGRASPKGNGR